MTTVTSTADAIDNLADLVEQYFKKGAQFYLEGHLRLDQWQDKNDGSKRSRLKIVRSAPNSP